MKKSRLLSFVLAPILAFAVAVPALSEGPTPTPQPKAKRKLGGGSFGQPPSTTPTPGTPATGSLADVVRKTQDESATPTGSKGRGIVITNETLGKAEKPNGGSSSSISISGSKGSKATAKARPTPTAPVFTVPEYKDASGRTEKDWKARAAGVRERADRAAAAVASAEAEARRLENDFYAWSDSNYRERVIRPAWDQAKEKLASLQAEVDRAREELANLEDEARKSGAPPGWLR